MIARRLILALVLIGASLTSGTGVNATPSVLRAKDPQRQDPSFRLAGVPASVPADHLLQRRVRTPAASRSRPPIPAPDRTVAGVARPSLDAFSVRGGRLNWTALARCESTNNPRANTGNGYYGAFQMDRSFWRTYGGLRFAPRADLATLAEQISVAYAGYQARGRQPWPHCGRYL